MSIFDLVELGVLLNMPANAKPIAIICLGHVNSFYKAPMLVETGWAEAKPLAQLVMENTWSAKSQIIAKR